MINLDEITRMVRVMPGEGLELPGERRRVRLELNTAEPCQIVLQTGPDDLRFLVNVCGRETVTFIAEGDVCLWPSSDGEVWWWCPEMETTSVAVPDAETFTKIAERRPRNHELERVAAKMAENANRRMAALEGRFGREVDALRRENETLKTEVKRGNPKPAADDNGNAGEGTGAPGGARRAKPAAAGDDGGSADAEN